MLNPELMIDMPIKAIPQFAAGLVYGLVEDNKLTEIEGCYSESLNFESRVKQAITDFKHGGTDYEIQGALEIALAALEIPIALNACESMSDDLHAIGSWATAFEDVTTLAATVTKHFLLHKKLILADIQTLKTDWADADYFTAGVDAANLLTIAVGPIEVTPTLEEVDFSVMAVPDFVAGLLYGFTGDNNLVEIEACAAGGKLELADFEAALKDLTEGHFIKAARSLKSAFADLSTDLAPCHAISDDVAALSEWALIFTHPAQLVETVGTHWLLHKKHIKSDLAQEKLDWAAGDYFMAGVDTADALTLLLGPVEPKPEAEEVDFSVMAVPDFVAGFLYGFTGDNHLTEVEACFDGATPLIEDVEASLKELSEGHIISSLREFEKAVYTMQVALEPCHHLSEDKAALEAWAAVFKEPAHLVEAAAKHWELHKRAIKADISQEKLDWAAGDYFKAGIDTADAFTLLVGKVE